MISGCVGGRGDAVGGIAGGKGIDEVQLWIVELEGRQLKTVDVVTGAVVVTVGPDPCWWSTSLAFD